MLKRKINDILSNWKSNPNRKPLVIKGCRQCGKTSSVKEFAKNHYKHIIYLDFHENKELRTIFTGSLEVDYLTMLISAAIKDAIFVANETCIIFDEIQECPQARTSLKYFKLDGRYDIICTGSLLGVNGYSSKNTDDEMASVPVGFEQIVEMYPMDFEEWLWANDITKPVFDFLNKSYRNETPVPEALHNRMRQLLNEYLIVGGMPEVVKTFMETHNLNQTLTLQRNIVDEYKMDMIKYANSEDRAKIRECFESIPRQLSRDNKKFTYSVVKKGGRSKDYISSLQWIEDAGIVRKCYNLSITGLPLSGNAMPDCFKVYMADTGLFISMLDDGTQFDILQGRLDSYKGAIYENIMADILGKMGRKLYYFQKNDSLEIDFVIRLNGECVPIECKARTGNAKSLKTLLNHPEKYHVTHAVKCGDYNVGRQDNVLTIPFYMAFMLSDM